jgi:carboxypeptidase PM20D1
LLIGIIIISVIALFFVVILGRTLAFRPPRAAAGTAPLEAPPSAEALARLSQAIAIPTVCNQDYPKTDFAPFDKFFAFLQEAFPLFHKTCELTKINGYALVYRWKGADPDLKPLALIAHYDVVPIEKGTEDQWKYPGFSGAIAEGRVWGRGALDIKSQLTSHLEAAENLMRRGFTPRRDIYFAYGQDEEIGGAEGASKVVEYFTEKGIRLEGLVDEGGLLVTGIVKSIKAPLALIGLGEKGMCDYEFTVEGTGGHSSMPPPHTALGKAAEAIRAIERRPMPPKLSVPTELFLRNIAGEMGFVIRMAVANLWLFKPLLLSILAKSPATNALVRTTFAATMAQASDAPNVLPQKARFVINSRLMTGDSTDAVAAHLMEAAAPAGEVTIRKLKPSEPSAISSHTSYTYGKLAALTLEFYPNAIVTPYLMVAASDSRKYTGLSDSVYRFTPMLISNEERATIHSTNESLSIENYGRMIAFYERFIEEFD